MALPLLVFVSHLPCLLHAEPPEAPAVSVFLAFALPSRNICKSVDSVSEGCVTVKVNCIFLVKRLGEHLILVPKLVTKCEKKIEKCN